MGRVGVTVAAWVAVGAGDAITVGGGGDAAGVEIAGAPAHPDQRGSKSKNTV
jgi:hypothetical protein